MLRRKMFIALIALTMSVLLIGCDCREQSYKETNDNYKNGNMINQNCFEEYNEHFAELDISEYDYPKSFELTSNIKQLLENVLRSSSTKEAMTDDRIWKEYLKKNYLQNSYFLFDYREELLKTSGVASRAQVEYVQWSMTGKYLSFDDNEEPLDIQHSSSGMKDAKIIDYNYEERDGRLEISGNAEITKIGGSTKENHYYTAVLERNPFSCFDGYSLVSFSDEEITLEVIKDGEEHVVYGSPVSDELIEDKSREGVIFIEPYAEDDLKYGFVLAVDLKDDMNMYNYMKANNHITYRISYHLDDSVVISKDVIQEIIPVEIEVEHN